MTLTKTAGALCGALLIFLLGGWAAEAIYSVGGHGDDHAQGYVIDTGEDETEEDTAEAEPDLATLFASADASKGERVFNQCRACHQVEDGNNGVGPHLYGVVARDVGSVDGFNYSGALGEAADVWNAEELYAFLENPAEYAPGTSMGYAGLSKPEDRVNVIAYLDETDGENNIQLASADADAPADEASMDEAATDDAAEADTAPADEGEGAAEDADAAAEEPAGDEAATQEAQADEAADEGDGTTDTAASDADATTEEAKTDDMAEADTAEETSTTEETDATETADGGASEFATMVASADVDAGEGLYRQCRACHQIDTERNGVGPHLVGIVGRDIASVDGFRYSDALSGLDGAWTLDELSAWIENPNDYAPGNKMGYRGLSDEQDRANLMAYLQSAGN
ncbi:c-type cytochrome [Roseovarius tibetensis]|uniref:c-type cytochrome n=1 Tax=Roseovarius tibetensis TaxID=2685897 RepID=UPI003D7F8127